MGKYWEYFKYVLEHKKNVFLECRKIKGMWWHGITHDLSKFTPREFKAYAEHFYGDKNCRDCKKCKDYMKCDYNQIGLGSGNFAKECYHYKSSEFEKGWKHHYKNNKHHWNYWIGKDMKHKYIVQMICDWKAMSKKFGGTAQEFYLNNYDKMDMTFDTRIWTEYELGLNDSEACGYGHTLKQFANKYDETTYNKYFGFIKERYGIDSYKLLSDK